MLSECQENRLPLSLTTSHPARRALSSSLALTMAESKVELLPTLLSAEEFFPGQWFGSKTRGFNSFKSSTLMKERG